MKIRDSRQDIPQWTWYNGQFLFQFYDQLKDNPQKSISDFFSEFLISQSLQNLDVYHTKNPGTVILLMYGLLVIPKEIWEKENTDFSFNTRSKFKFIIPKYNNINTLDFLRFLRNSLAHANFSIDATSSKLTFWNCFKEERNFEVEISYANLGQFISEIGKYYINEVKLINSNK